MLKLLIVLLLIFPKVALAEGFAGLGGSARFIKNVENNFELKFPVQLYAGYRFLPWAVAFEAEYFELKSKSGSSFMIDRKHYEASFYGMWFFSYEEARAINPYVLGGVGLFQTHLETDLMGTKSKDKSSIDSSLKVGLGSWAALGERGFLSLESKAMYSKALAPDLTFEVSARAGVLF